LLNSNNSTHNVYNKYDTNTYPIGPSQYNRFSILDSQNHSYNPLENLSPHGQSSSIPYKNKKQLSSRSVLSNQTRNNNNSSAISRSHKSPRKPEKSNINVNNTFNTHRKLLYSPNGRLPSTASNGAGYCTRQEANSISESNCVSHNNGQDVQANFESHTYDNECNNVNITSLTSAFLSLTKNMECMYHLIRSICLPNNENAPSLLRSHSRSSYNTNEK